jgi:DNA-binding transcriptional regulator YdaS (Cro superfamily)
MKLAPFLKTLPRGAAATLAGQVGISTVYLSQLAVGQGGREPSPELCVRIENATLKQVRRWDLRPTDWHLIWPELITDHDAPKRAANDEPAAGESAGAAVARTA